MKLKLGLKHEYLSQKNLALKQHSATKWHQIKNFEYDKQQPPQCESGHQMKQMQPFCLKITDGFI